MLQGPGVPQPPSGNSGAPRFLTTAAPLASVVPLASAAAPPVRRLESCPWITPGGAKSGLAGTAWFVETVELSDVKFGRTVGLITPGLVVPRLRDCASANGIAQTATSRSR